MHVNYIIFVMGWIRESERTEYRPYFPNEKAYFAARNDPIIAIVTNFALGGIDP